MSSSAPPLAGQQGWTWDGAEWVWDPTVPPVSPYPPPGWPPPGFPPWYGGANSPPWYPGANAGVSFGLTAPQNPVRGHLWWDGTNFWLFDGAAWVNTAGTAGAPGANTTTQTFSLTSGNVALGASTTWEIIPITAAPTIDLQNAWNASTHKVTPTKPGWYTVLTRAYFGAGQTLAQMACFKNDSGTFNTGVAVTIAADANPVAGMASYLFGNNLTHMNGSTDFLRLWGYTNDGTLYSSGLPMIDLFLMP
jgi:hypothetical protein